ncbi:hypothetical protein ILUMI_13288 [Ignelater luminosus]|uniref:Apolipophorin-III n=1 Tax=Ignelater luminosus TaxID=2038154 RepID=A0A8K0CSJ3_IGNLU|nr:hypothetical protein ILUMI_13288 [Ignelater luminosus]
MAKFAVFFIAALAFQAALAAPKKNQGAAAAGKSQLEEVAEQVQHVVTEVHTSLQNVLPDSKQVTQALGTQSQEFARNVQNIVNKLQAEIDKNKGQVDSTLQQISVKLTENINALKQAVGPDATAKANEIRTQLDNHLKNSAAEIDKLVKVVQPNLQHAGESINAFAKGVLDDFLKAAENLKNQVDTTIQSKGQKH